MDGQYVGEKTTISGVEYLITYLYGDNGIAGINVNGEDYYFVKNIQGDVIAILYADGSLLATYEYDAYGYFYAARNSRGTKITSQSNVANLNPFRYRGYMYDQETGFYYLRSRYYDPEVGRFLNADSLVFAGHSFDGFNMFVYCLNNPVNYLDKEGTSATELQWWVSVMSWLPFSDSVLPFGDIIYIGGILVCGIIVLASSENSIPDISDITYNEVGAGNSFPDPDDGDDDDYDNDDNYSSREKIGKSKGNPPAVIRHKISSLRMPQKVLLSVSKG